MNKGMLTVGIIVLALMGLLLINLISNYSTGSELDYYLVKETVEASIEDAIDVKYYRDNGAIRMDKDKFVESFLRRFADSVDNTRNYRVSIYDLNEVPPKVSVKVTTKTDDFTIFADTTSVPVVNKVDAILEVNLNKE